MTTIKEIMQIGVGMSDRETFALFHDLLGFPTTNSADGTATYMRVDRYSYRVAARTTPEPVLNYISLDVGGPDALSPDLTDTMKGLKGPGEACARQTEAI